MLVMIYHTIGCVPSKPYRVTNIIKSNLTHSNYFSSLKEDVHKISSNNTNVYLMCMKEGIVCIPNNYSRLELPDQSKATKVTLLTK